MLPLLLGHPGPTRGRNGAGTAARIGEVDRSPTTAAVF